MTVFRGYLKGALRQKAVIILYLIIFLGLGTIMTWSMDEGANDTYEAETLSMAVIDRDHSALSEGLAEYLENTQDVHEIADEKAVLQEELYYGNIQYVLVIPEGFGEALETTGALLEGTGRPGATQTYYASELAEGYLSGAALYLQAGYSADEAADAMRIQADSVDENVVTFAEGSSSMSKVAGTFRYLAYVLTALACYVIGFVVLDYQQIDIQRRLSVSATSFAKRTMQMLLAFAVIGAAFYVVSFLMVALMNPHGIWKEPNMQYYALNVLAMVVVALSMAFLVVHLAGTGNGINGLANSIALGMSFFCGVFIPDSMLSASVRRIAHVFPVYWYEQNNTILGTHTVLSESLTGRFWMGFLWQMVFAGIVFVLAMILKKRRESKTR